ncbi:hypothetical protein OG488_29460 [Streptomyces sp. NBC_01460]|uniref:hypothetical protein n=1 Tax=Streptomyces sp. NBC_01460 TaxID=2903875 RepID=UPI002E306701|nr:hypothetical protein [Streptomyces sp. NBC_01460]
MAQFLVLVDGEAGGWRVDREALTAAIRARWSDVEVDSTHRSEARGNSWHFGTESGPGEAYLHQDGTCLYLDVRHEGAAWLSVAFRRLAPADLDLIFCDEDFTFDVRLRAEATDAERTAPMNDV